VARPLAFGFFLVVSLGIGPARAQDADGQTRVLAVTSDEALIAALEAVLSPWGVALVAVPAPSPGTSMPGSADRGLELARTHGVDAVVWVSESEEGFALWTYDVESARAAARRLSTGSPMSEATAASVALSVKTLLRNTSVAPAEPPSTDEPIGRGTVSASPAPAPADVDSTPHVFIEPLVGMRLGHDGSAVPELRFGLGVGLWPGARRAGVILHVMSGPGFTIDTATFSGRLIDVTVAAGAAMRLPLGDFGLGGSARVGIQVTSLDGSVLPSGQAANELRVNPHASVYARADHAPSERVRLVLHVGASFLMQYQNYRVRGRSVFEQTAVGLDVHLGLEVGLD
jgi:hypothetical protein